MDAEIAAMKDAVGAENNAQLADFIGVSRNAISLWRKRNSIPESARRKVATLARYGAGARAMDEKRIELGGAVIHAGRCLALALAPSVDSLEKGGRYHLSNYGEVLTHYSSYFRELELSFAEMVAERQQLSGEKNASEAMSVILREQRGDYTDLYERAIQRAYAWRAGEATQ